MMILYLALPRPGAGPPRLDFLDNPTEHVADGFGDTREFLAVDSLHGGDWVNGGNFDMAVLVLLHDHIARKQGTNFVLEPQSLVSHLWIAGAENTIGAEGDVEFVFESCLYVNVGEHAEAVPLQ